MQVKSVLSPEFNALVIPGVTSFMILLHLFAATADILLFYVISIFESLDLSKMPLNEGESPRIWRIDRSTSLSEGGGGPLPVLCSLCALAFSLAVSNVTNTNS